MTNKDVDFETWFENLCDLLRDEDGIVFSDSDSVRADYDQGRDLFDVKDEIKAEYAL